MTNHVKVCFIRNCTGKTMVISNGEVKDLKIPKNFGCAQLKAAELLREFHKIQGSESYILAAHLESIVWTNILPAHVLKYNRINPTTTQLIKLDFIRGLLSNIRIEGFIKSYAKFLLSLALTKLSSHLFRKKHDELFIVESLSGFRYSNRLRSCDRKVDIGTACLSDIKTHAREILTGKYLFVGIYYPIVSNQKIGAINADDIFLKLKRLERVVAAANLKWSSYRKIYSYDKIERHVGFLEYQQRNNTPLVLCQHGVVGPLYYNAIRPGIADRTFNFEIEWKWFPKPQKRIKTSEYCQFKKLLFFNEFLCDQNQQSELMSSLSSSGFEILFKDRPAGDYYAMNHLKKNILDSATKRTSDMKPLIFQQLDDLLPSKHLCLALVFHSSILYELLSKGFHVLVVDNFLFEESQLKALNIQSTTSANLKALLTGEEAI